MVSFATFVVDEHLMLLIFEGTEYWRDFKERYGEVKLILLNLSSPKLPLSKIWRVSLAYLLHFPFLSNATYLDSFHILFDDGIRPQVNHGKES